MNKKIFGLLFVIPLAMSLGSCNNEVSFNMNDYNQKVSTSDAISIVSNSYDAMKNISGLKINQTINDESVNYLITGSDIVNGVVEQTNTANISLSTKDGSVEIFAGIDKDQPINNALTMSQQLDEYCYDFSYIVNDETIHFSTLDLSNSNVYITDGRIYYDFSNTNIKEEILEIINLFSSQSSDVSQIIELLNLIGDKVSMPINFDSFLDTDKTNSTLYELMPSSEDFLNSLTQLFVDFSSLEQIITFNSDGTNLLISFDLTIDKISNLIADYFNRVNPGSSLDINDIKDELLTLFDINKLTFNFIIDSNGFIRYFDSDIDINMLIGYQNLVVPGDSTRRYEEITTMNVVLDCSTNIEYGDFDIRLPDNLLTYFYLDNVLTKPSKSFF